MKREILSVISCRDLNAGVYELVLSGASDMRAGQFVELSVPGFYLRRPISVADCADGVLTLLVKEAGEGTKKLRTVKSGDTVDALTGLGNGFDLNAEKPLLVGGGIGCAPLYKLAKDFAAAGVRATAVLGFRNAAEVYYAEEFSRFCDVVIATDDGSAGVRGNAVSAAEGIDFDRFYACGPQVMLRAAAQKLVYGQVSLEARMGCGFGACMGCSIKTTKGYARVCKEGPVFEAEEVVW